MTTLSVNVMHASFDPSRVAMLREFQAKAGASVAVIEDADRSGLWPTARRAWLAGASQDSDWHIVMQDDMHPCRGALERMRGALSEIRRPAVVSFFQPAVGPARVIREYIDPWRQGVRMMPMDNAILWGGTMALPTRLIAPMIDWLDRCMPHPAYAQADDERIMMWAWMHRVQPMCYAPGLFEHVGWDASVSSGVVPEPWKRGMLIADEHDGTEHAEHWQAMSDAVVCTIIDGRDAWIYRPDVNSGAVLRMAS